MMFWMHLQQKWNFLKFQPGLVGGHCIGVDPYYLAQIIKVKNRSKSYFIRKKNK